MYEQDHGRTINYTLESTPVLNDSLAFSEAAQFGRWICRIIDQRSRQQRKHVKYLVALARSTHTYTGSTPQALAALRNAVASMLRVEGWPYLPNGLR